MPSLIPQIPGASRGPAFMAGPGPEGGALGAPHPSHSPAHLPMVERVLGQLAPAPRGMVAGLVAWFTGTMDRDRLLNRYQAYCQAAVTDGTPERRRTLRELRASFERFQDDCSTDDYLQVQKAYPEIDAVLARLQAQQDEVA